MSRCAGGPPSCPGVVRWPSWMSGSVWKALPDGREDLSNVWEWLKGYPKYPGVVRRPSWMSGSFRETIPNVREFSGGPPG